MNQNGTHNLNGRGNFSALPRRRRVEVSAGGVIFRRKQGRLEFLFIQHGKSGRWTFPKGHQELGESLIQTAIREIREEVGLSNLRFIGSAGKTAFRFKRDQKLIEKQVHFFLFEASGDAKVSLSGEEAIGEFIWAPVQEVFAISGYRNLDRVLSQALRMIAEERRRK